MITIGSSTVCAPGAANVVQQRNAEDHAEHDQGEDDPQPGHQEKLQPIQHRAAGQAEDQHRREHDHAGKPIVVDEGQGQQGRGEGAEGPQSDDRADDGRHQGPQRQEEDHFEHFLQFERQRVELQNVQGVMALQVEGARRRRQRRQSRT